MFEQATPLYGRLVFDRDAIVRAALRAYLEGCLKGISRFGFPCIDDVGWTGDRKRGTVRHDDGEGNYEVIAWNEAGVVGLALDAWQGPMRQLGLSVDAVTGGPDDVRGAVPALPAELESAFVMAVGRLEVGGDHGEKLAGIGFWLHGDHAGGTLLTVHDRNRATGGRRLAPWGLLHKGRLLPLHCESYIPRPGLIVTAFVEPKVAPCHAIVDAVTDRALKGPTEFTPEELETLLRPEPDPKQLPAIQRGLQKVGITWPGSPAIPEPTPLPPRRDLYAPATTVGREHYIGYLAFDRDTIVRAALRAHVENILGRLDPLQRHRLPVCAESKWTGDLQRGALYNRDYDGDYEVVAWTEAGVVGLAYERGFGPIEQLGLSIDAVKGGPDDVAAALPELPAELLPAFEMAADKLDVGSKYGEKLSGVGFWLYGNRVAGTLFDNPPARGFYRLATWGLIKRGRLDWQYFESLGPLATWFRSELDATTAAPIHAIVDAVVDRRLAGPTELLADELATLIPTPPDPKKLAFAQQQLQKVGITWPGSPAIPE